MAFSIFDKSKKQKAKPETPSTSTTGKKSSLPFLSRPWKVEKASYLKLRLRTGLSYILEYDITFKNETDESILGPTYIADSFRLLHL